MAGYPLRHWSMKIVLLHADTKQEIDADIFESVTYILHESFGDKAEQSMYHTTLTFQTFKVELTYIYSLQEATISRR